MDAKSCRQKETVGFRNEMLQKNPMRVSWKDRIKNASITAKPNGERSVVDTIKARKLQLFGHIMSNGGQSASKVSHAGDG